MSSTPEAYEIIRDFHRSGACEIGAHLQPWDNPPFVEPKTDENSYPGNLPFELEREKLVQLSRIIQENIGTRPRIYKAGRYGVGHSTARILAELGYEIDLSVVPGTDLSPQFGPDFSHCGVRPYWFGEAEALLEIPLSIGYAGLLAHSGGLAYALTMNARLKALHVPGILARLHLIERISLTPEGISFEEQRRLTRALLREGQRVFNFTYHSPSLAPGNTPTCAATLICAPSCAGSRNISSFSSERSAAGQRPHSKSKRSQNGGARHHKALPGLTGSGSVRPRTSSRQSSGLRKLARRFWFPVRACRDIAGKAGLPPENARVELRLDPLGRPCSPKLQPAAAKDARRSRTARACNSLVSISPAAILPSTT